MISTKEYKEDIKVGDLIWFHKDNPEGYGGEDIGYVRNIHKVKGLTKYSITWFKSYDGINSTEETKQSIKDMEFSYILPAL
jgi:hypothetical protein